MRVVSLFTGIGAFEKALSNLGIKHEVVAFSEIDRYASTAYCSIHGVSEDLNLGDVTKIIPNEVPDCDLITHGSPCQSFSVAGKGDGGDKGSGTRSSLMWHTVDIVTHKKPKFVIWENVKGVLTKTHRHNFDSYLQEMENLGYKNYFEVLNAKNYGIPQNRERIYVISIRTDVDEGTFNFPEPFDNGLRLKHLLESEVDEKYYIQSERVDALLEDLRKRGLLTGERFCADSTLNDPQKREISNCIIARYDAGIVNQKQSGLIVVEPNTVEGINVSKQGTVYDHSTEIASCLLARDYKGLGNQSMTVVIEANELDSVGNIYPSKGQNGEIYTTEGISPTLRSGQGVVGNGIGSNNSPKILEPVIVASRGRNPEDPSDRTTGSPTEQRLEMNSNGTTNTITTVQKDNLVLEPNLVEASPKRLGGLYDKDGKKRQAGAVWDQESIAPTLDTMQGGHREPCIIEGYIERKYQEFIAENGYIPNAFNPYNCQEIKGIAPTVTTQCGSTTSSSTVLFTEDENNQLMFLGGISDNDWAKDGKELSRNYPQGSRVCDSNGRACSQTANGGGLGGPTGLYLVVYRIRKLTPKECWRLMSFSDESYEKAKLALMEKHYNGKDRTNSQMYKMAGNSICVNVLEEIFKNLFLVNN